MMAPRLPGQGTQMLKAGMRLNESSLMQCVELSAKYRVCRVQLVSICMPFQVRFAFDESS